MRVLSCFPVTRVILSCLRYCSRDLQRILEFYVIFPLSSWTSALLCHGADGSVSCGLERHFWVNLVQITHSQQRGILTESHWDGVGWMRSGSAGIGGSKGAQKQLQEHLQLCFEHFLPSRGVPGPGCDSGRGGAHGSAAVHLLAGMKRLRWGITGGFAQTRRGRARGWKHRLETRQRFTPGQLRAG